MLWAREKFGHAVAEAAEFQRISAFHAHAERRHIVLRAQGGPPAFPPMASNITEMPMAHASSLASDGLPNAVRQTDAGQVAGALGPASEPAYECLPWRVPAFVQAPSRGCPLQMVYLAGLNSGRVFVSARQSSQTLAGAQGTVRPAAITAVRRPGKTGIPARKPAPNSSRHYPRERSVPAIREATARALDASGPRGKSPG